MTEKDPLWAVSFNLQVSEHPELLFLVCLKFPLMKSILQYGAL
jgi:hypothetical protein